MRSGVRRRVDDAWSSAVDKSGPSRLRLLAALGVVLLTGATVWLWGRAEDPETAPVVVATEDWGVGAQGAYAVLPVPADIAWLFAAPEQLEGMAARVRIPSGAAISPAMLAPVEERHPEVTHWRLDADISLWPFGGPKTGDMAVFATERGGCALAVTPLAFADGSGSVTVAVDQGSAAIFAAAERLVVWPAPPENLWRMCEGGLG